MTKELDTVELAHQVLALRSGNTTLEEVVDLATGVLAKHFARRVLPVVLTDGEEPEEGKPTSVYVRAQAPAEADWRTAELCQEFSLLGMAKMQVIGGVPTVDIGHLIEEAVSNVFPEDDVAPWKSVARQQYEDYLAEQELGRMKEQG